MNNEICKELSEICKGLAEHAKYKDNKKYEKEFSKRANAFKALAQMEVSDMTNKITPQQKEKKEFEKQRNIVIKELVKLEKKYGSEMFKSACNRKLTIDRELKRRQKDIKKLENELSSLKDGKLVY